MTKQAKLVHGNTYTLNRGKGTKSKLFEKDEWVDISEQEYEWLEANAKERVTIAVGAAA